MPGQILGPEEKAQHDRLVTEVARQKFACPTREYPTCMTYTNEPVQRVMVYTGSGPVYPDIVVVDGAASNKLVMIGEVETEATITQDHVQQWRTYSALNVPFFLYVPLRLVQEARNLLSSNGVSVPALRSYSNDAQGNLQITNV